MVGKIFCQVFTLQGPILTLRKYYHYYDTLDNTKAMVRSPDGDTNFFDIVAGVLQGDTLAAYMFKICQNYVLQTSIDMMKENGFPQIKARNRRYTADADFVGDLALPTNRHAS